MTFPAPVTAAKAPAFFTSCSRQRTAPPGRSRRAGPEWTDAKQAQRLPDRGATSPATASRSRWLGGEKWRAGHCLVGDAWDSLQPCTLTRHPPQTDGWLRPAKTLVWLGNRRWMPACRSRAPSRPAAPRNSLNPFVRGGVHELILPGRSC
jgi:hypothetical protein